MSVDVLYKMMTKAVWEASLGQEYMQLAEMDIEDGFVHFCTQEQLMGKIEKFFPDQDCIVAKVKVSELIGDLRYESNPGRKTKYYHLYEGKILMSSIVAVYHVSVLKG